MTRLTPAVVLLAAALPLANRAGAQLPVSLEVRVPTPPTSVRGGERSNLLVYELHLTNLTSASLTVQRIEVLNGATRSSYAVLADSALASALARPGQTLALAERARIGPGSRAVVFMWLPSTPDATTPTSLRHRVTVERTTPNRTDTVSIETTPILIAGKAAVIGPPLRGGPWLAANGPGAASPHRRAMIALEGAPHIAQRFAIDYVKLNERSSTFRGDSLLNQSYVAYGDDVLAVADAEVVAVKDGIPENVPQSPTRAVPITLETIGGNHVILRLGDGRFAFYAHLKPGSLRVKLGDRVRRGQVLGLLGNSGNSTEPHLHFHLADANSPLASEGIPYEHERFDVVGSCVTLNAECTRTAPQSRRAAMPVTNELVSFPP
jgi:murein DD-endopeptidase